MVFAPLGRDPLNANFMRISDVGRRGSQRRGSERDKDETYKLIQSAILSFGIIPRLEREDLTWVGWLRFFSQAFSFAILGQIRNSSRRAITMQVKQI